MDQKSLVAAYERYQQQLYRFCFSIVGSAADAEEALQNTMIKALRALPGEERQIQLKPWLYRIAHNESIELLRRRRDEVEVDPELVASAADPVETAEQRQRLRSLFADLAQLPERQRGALIMRELGGLEFEQIGEALDTSASVARQTVYEARLGLRQMDAGREMSCDEVTQRLSAEDGRVMRRRDIRAHLRTCPDCRAFRDAIATRKQDMAALAPLPTVAAAGLLQAVLGATQGSATGAGLAGTVGAGAGAGKAVATSAVVKSAATVAVVAVLGTTAADRGGLIDVIPGDGNSQTRLDAAPAAPGAATTVPGEAVRSEELERVRQVRGADGDLHRSDDQAQGKAAEPAPGTTLVPTAPGENASEQLPAAARHGQEVAESHGGGRAHGESRSQAKGKSQASAKGKSAAKSKPKGAPKGQAHPSPPPHSAAGKQASSPSGSPPASPPGQVGPDKPVGSPLQPSQPPKSQGATGAAGGPSSKEAR